MMTVAAAFMGLLPIMWSTSAGADVMKRIAAPMIGGLVTSFVLELLVYPAIYKLWKQREIGNPPGPRAASEAGFAGSAA
jgi:Cu(I)/Ag(I) efflux system membrane protein CusA/SilA